MVLTIKGITDKETTETLPDSTLNTDLDATEGIKPWELIPHADENLHENYSRSDLLFVPEMAKNFYKERGYDLRWVRIIEPDSKKHDTGHIQRKEQQGFIFVKRNEVPGLDGELESVFGDVMTDHRGLYVVNDCALARIPFKLLERKAEEKLKRTQMRTENVRKHLKKEKVAPSEEHGEVYDVGSVSTKGDREVTFGE